LIVIARQGTHELSLAQTRDEWQAALALLHKRAARVLARREGTHHPMAPR
jgi:hypothetical protein